MVHHQMNAKRKIEQILQSVQFCESFTLCKDWKKNREFTERDVSKWIFMCCNQEVPPYMLLVAWLKGNNVFDGNKNIAKFVRKQKVKKELSWLHRLCVSVAKLDESCMFHEKDRAQRAKGLEKLAFQRIKQMLRGAGIPFEMYSEADQKQMKGTVRLSPDILFSHGMMINGHKVHWMDMKNFLVMQRDSFMWKKLKKTCRKYNEAFGSGAILCKGFQSDVQKPDGVIFLDAFAL